MSRHDFAAMRAALRGGVAVQAVAAPQLFPTPPDIAARMVEKLEGWNGEAWDTMRVLEPSAGTGNLIAALLEEWPGANVTAYEINQKLVDMLRAKNKDAGAEHYQADFLTVTPNQVFDAVLMNPPFERGSWATHVRHAWKFLKPGGRLVAVLPQAPSLHDVARGLSPDWESESLPAGTFAGTGVRTALVTIDKPEASE